MNYTLNSDNASLGFRMHFGIIGYFTAKCILDPDTKEIKSFVLYDQEIKKGISYFHDLKAMYMEAKDQ